MTTKEIKFLMDVGVGKIVDLWLLNHGYNVKSIRDINPRMPDPEILKIAVTERRMVVTMDKDFGDLVYNSGQAHAGVLLLRLEDANADEKIKGRVGQPEHSTQNAKPRDQLRSTLILGCGHQFRRNQPIHEGHKWREQFGRVVAQQRVFGFRAGIGLARRFQKVKPVMMASTCAEKVVELFEYSPESRPLWPTFCVAGM